MLISKYYPSKALIWDIRWSKQIIHDINIPQIIHFIFGFPLVNHPAIEVPPWLWKPRSVKILSNPCIRLLDGSPIHPSSHHSVVSYVRNAQTNHLIAALGTESTAGLTWSFTTFPRGVVTWEVWMPGFYYQRNPTNGIGMGCTPNNKNGRKRTWLPLFKPSWDSEISSWTVGTFDESSEKMQAMSSCFYCGQM